MKHWIPALLALVIIPLPGNVWSESMSGNLIFSVFGVAGYLLYVLNYTRLVDGAIDGKSCLYIFTNLLAAICILVSLVEQFNLGSLLIQLTWIVVSVYGLVLIHRRESRKLVVDIEL